MIIKRKCRFVHNISGFLPSCNPWYSFSFESMLEIIKDFISASNE